MALTMQTAGTASFVLLVVGPSEIPSTARVLLLLVPQPDNQPFGTKQTDTP